MLSWKAPFQFSYDRLEDDDESKSMGSAPVWQTSPKPKRMLDSRAIPWAISSVLTLILIWLLFEKHENSRREHLWGSYEKGFATDITSAELRHVRFHSSFWVDDDNMWHMTTNSSEPRYVGPPSPEVDQAWEDALYPRFMPLKPQDARELGIRFSDKDLSYGRIWVEPSGFHDLHCVNYIRQALDREYYPNITSARGIPEVPGKSGHRLHLDHCIELLRQSLTCHLDLTPVPRLWLVGDLLHANQDQVHTCRDFQSVKKWVSDRSAIPDV